MLRSFAVRQRFASHFFRVQQHQQPFCLRPFSNGNDNNTSPEKAEYVHPLSQLVLEYLQTTRASWVERNGLDRGLKLQRDGTFVLKFPSFEQDGARIWYESHKSASVD